MVKNCPMRHENGNCIPAGGFCTANKNICEALLNAYRMGKEGTTSDLISRQAVINAIENTDAKMSMPEWDEITNAVMSLPTVQPELHEGHWIPDNNNAYEMRFVCSCCKESEVVPTIGFTKYKPLWDFCPNCGADMRGEKDG